VAVYGSFPIGCAALVIRSDSTLEYTILEQKMKNLHKGNPPGTRLFFALGIFLLFFPACCPTGAWEDNFGRVYSIVTTPSPDLDQPILTSGTVDTMDLGCGVWPIRPPGEGEPPQAPGDVAWVAENPNPNPADQCCYAFRFDGQVTGSGCSVIIGAYQNVGGKCQQSGEMFLLSLL
jgi:hypothetical protein